MTEQPKFIATPLRRTTLAALQLIKGEYLAKLQGLADSALADGEVQPGTQLDPDNGVWISPAPQETPAKSDV